MYKGLIIIFNKGGSIWLKLKIFKNYLSPLASKFNSNFIFSTVSMLLSVFVIFSLSLTVMSSRPVMMMVGIHSIPDVEISNVMYANAEACGVDRESFQEIIEDMSLKQIMVSASVERIEALLMRRDTFSATTENLLRDISEVISSHVSLDEESLNNLSQYVFYLTGTQTIASDSTPEEYRHSAYVLGEKLEDEGLVEMDGAYSILAFMMNGQFAVVSLIFWITFLFITIFLGRRNTQKTVRELYFKHYPAALFGVAVSIGFLLINWKGLGVVFQTLFICVLVISALFFALESGAVAIYFNVIHKRESQENAKECLRQIREPYIKKYKKH